MVKYLPGNEGDTGDVGSIAGSGRSPGEVNETHSSTLSWKTPWTKEPGGLQPMGVAKSQTRQAHVLTP